MEEGKMNNYTQMQIDELIKKADELIKKVEKFSYVKFGIALYIALTLSTLVSDLVRWKAASIYMEIAAQNLKNEMEAEARISKQRMDAEAKNLAARNAEIARQQAEYQAEQQRIANANRIRAENQAEVQKQRLKTCQFWNDEYNRTKSEIDNNHRRNACGEAGIRIN